MRVLLFHPSHLPPKDYGGVERVVLWLARGLTELGHSVDVAAFEGSRLPRGVGILPMSPEQPSERAILPFQDRYEIIHFMAPPRSLERGELKTPALVTIHGNGQAGEVFPLNSVFLSQDHAARHEAQVFVHNGIDPSEYEFDPTLKSKAPHVLFLSKTSWKVKNLAQAMKLCSQARVPLRIAGGSRPIGLRARAAIGRWMGLGNQRWVGPVAGQFKARVLAEASALVFPVKWPEPFGLVIAEALISGTPVIGSRVGSIPELLTPQVGAVIDLDAQDEWIDAIQSALRNHWDPEACRQWALERFHYITMSKAYLDLYTRVCGGASLHERPPRTPNLTSFR